MTTKKQFPFDLVIIETLAILCAFFSISGAGIPVIRVIAALPLLLILPGIALQLAVFPKRLFSNAEQFILVVGISIMLDAILGVILNALRIPLKSITWAVTLGGFVLLACLVAAFRRERLNLDSPLSFAIDLNWIQILIVGLAIVFIGGAISLVDLPLKQPAIDQGYTILWIQPDQTESNVIHVGIVSNEFAANTYNLSLVANEQVLYQWIDIKLAPGEKWENEYKTSSQLLPSTRVEALLYKQNNLSTVYRRVWLYQGQAGASTHAP